MIYSIKKLYPQKYSVVYLLFDISLLLYFVAYMVYFEAGEFNDRIRSISTYLLLATGLTLWLINAFRISIFSFWYIIFLLFGLTSVLWAAETTNVISIMPSMVRIVLLTIFLYVRIKNDVDLKITMKLFVLGVVYLSVIVIQGMINYFSASTFYLYRLGLNIGYNPNTIAISAVFGCIILFDMLFKERTMWRLIDLSLLVFLIGVIFLTGSKKGLIGLVFGILAYGYFKSKGIKKIRNIIGSLILLIIIWQVIMNVPALYDTVGHRIDTALNAFTLLTDADTSTQNRVGLIREAINVWFKHPVFGVGLNNFSAYQDIGGLMYYSHCNYVEMLADLGLVGLILYYFMPISLFARYTRFQNGHYSILFKTLIVTILLWDIAMVSYQDFRVQLILCFAFICVGKKSFKEQDNTN